MLYKKYAIEVIYSSPVIVNVGMIPNIIYNGMSVILSNNTNLVNIVKYVDDYGILLDEPTSYYTYHIALQTLNRYYYHIKGQGTYSIKTMKIVEIYDDIIPPIDVMRFLKIRKIIKK